ncbi:MAG: glucuronyl hydrolase [Kiritimatiellia bacterium]
MRHPLASAPILAAAFCACGVLAASAAPATPAEQALARKLPAVYARCAEQYRGLLKQMASQQPDMQPKRWQNGKLVVIPPKDWCSGFFPGSLWYLYEKTGEAFWKEAATRYTDRLLEPLRHDASNHDVGFRTYCSAGNALRLTRDPKYAAFLHDTAAALRTRYDDDLGLICSWGNPKGRRGTDFFTPQYIVIIDNMMNLELLEWDAKNGGDPKSDLISRSQADLTDRHHFRADGSAYHVLDYNRVTKKVHGVFAGQGACVEGTWSRGHGWAVYGFTMMYRETRKPAYLARAMKCADYWMNEPNLPADGVAYWDFKAPQIPNEERDASAAAIVASALLELCRFAPAEKAAAYRAFGVKILSSLASDAYLAKAGENGNFLLMHCVGNKPGWYGNPESGEVDVPLNYADYYFLEALLRFEGLVK